MTRRPLIGITPDIEHRDGNPDRDWYFLDAANIPPIIAAGGVPVMLPHAIDLIDDYLDRLDGVWVSGGGYQWPDAKLIDWRNTAGEPPEKVARARFELELVARVEARRMPILGACGGFQLMNVAAGGTIIPVLTQANPAWKAHRDGKRFDEAAHLVSATPGSRLAGIVGADSFAVNSRHAQGAIEPGPLAQAAAWSPDGVLEAIERPDMPFWVAVQWHPEFHISPADARLISAFVEAAAKARA